MAQFTNHLASLGHTTLTVGGYGDAARHFTVWLRQSSIAIARVDDNTCAEFAAHRCRCPGIRRCDRVSAKYARRARRFVWFLAECGVVDKLALPGPAPVEPRVALFQDWLRQHRGISESTISRYGRMVVRLQIALGADPAHYTAASIRRAILDELRGTSAAHVKTMTTALRGYLRFLGASGACDLELMRAVPTIPQWRLSALPRYLPAEDVDRVIASCDAGKARGIRDRAILLLLSRLGLRAASVSDNLFISVKHGPLPYDTAAATFRRLARSVGLRGGAGEPGPRIHDLRHTFAVRSLEGCASDRHAITRHLLALSTYLGHARVADTYWYLEATPVLLREVADAGEILLRGVPA